MSNNPASVIVMLLLAAFVIDRIATASLFALSFSKAWTQRYPDPSMVEQPAEKRQAARNQKLIYFVLAGALALSFLLLYKNVGVLSALGFQADEAVASQKTTTDPSLTPTPTPTPSTGTATLSKPPRSAGDFFLTWLLLVGGAENIAKLLKGYGDNGRKTESQPIEITGKLTLEERPDKGDKG